MAEPSPQAAPQARSGDRVEAALVVFMTAGMLVVAALLHPDPEGFGTHRELLPLPCIFRTLTALPCPFCGLTTAFAYMSRLEVLAAFRAHALGPLAYVLTWALGLRGAYALVRGVPVLPGWLGGRRASHLVLVLLIGGWLINIVHALLSRC